MAIWTAEPKHDWPGGKYIGAICATCGVTGFMHHKNGPRLCWPHHQEGMRDAEWSRAKWESDMVAEFGPHIPRPDLFRREFPAPTTRPGDQDG